MMQLNLQAFAKTGEDGSNRLSSGRGSAGSAGNYDKEREYWWDVTAKAGVGSLADRLEDKNGGPLGEKKVSTSVNSKSPLGQKLAELVGKKTGSDNIDITRSSNGDIIVAVNRAGFAELSAWLRKQLKKGKWW